MLSIVVGWRIGELLEPHGPGISKDLATKIRERAKEVGSKKYVAVAFPEDFSGHREAEVFGMWEDLCVASSVASGLITNVNIRVPKGFTVRSSYKKEISLRDLVDYYCLNKGLAHSYREDGDYHYFVPVKF